MENYPELRQPNVGREWLRGICNNPFKSKKNKNKNRYNDDIDANGEFDSLLSLKKNSDKMTEAQKKHH